MPENENLDPPFKEGDEVTVKVDGSFKGQSFIVDKAYLDTFLKPHVKLRTLDKEDNAGNLVKGRAVSIPFRNSTDILKASSGLKDISNESFLGPLERFAERIKKYKLASQGYPEGSLVAIKDDDKPRFGIGGIFGRVTSSSDTPASQLKVYRVVHDKPSENLRTLVKLAHPITGRAARKTIALAKELRPATSTEEEILENSVPCDHFNVTDFIVPNIPEILPPGRVYQVRSASENGLTLQDGPGLGVVKDQNGNEVVLKDNSQILKIASRAEIELERKYDKDDAIMVSVEGKKIPHVMKYKTADGSGIIVAACETGVSHTVTKAGNLTIITDEEEKKKYLEMHSALSLSAQDNEPIIAQNEPPEPLQA